ncbi:hypothetical protein FC19_GL000275 [Liquorilactobacillus aquaticus DSM 21051]|uniref:Uncharacterized protein n=1 Tax=Liquorilactobacillus aquaticus DSM 21051 TaxID=1423725 RepID=A0A0R2CYI6_9LACO|nr:hypothetical protein FC19_GL000275 [Liquorilactobacillus aquaticus DSM 21051]
MLEKDTPFNMGHFVSKKNTQLMNDMNSNKAWNNSYRVEKSKEWQAYVNDQAAYAPGSFSYQWSPVNHRVKGFNVSSANNEFWSNLSLTSANLK